MLLTCLIVVYISFICWGYGQIFLALLKRFRYKLPTPSPFIHCYIGLAFIGVIFSWVSIFLPLSGIIPQILLVIPLITTGIVKKEILNLKIVFKNFKADLNFPFFATITACIFLVLLMHAHTINHPDTLNYHAQNIKWIEKYKAIPGIANLYGMFGLQSSWFILSALFSFKFAGTSALTFINAAVLFWFILFVINKINFYYTNAKKAGFGLLWVGLLVLSFWSYTQVRLCASSGSPDFITALYLWLIFYLLWETNEPMDINPLLVTFLCFFAVTIKLQALVVILISLYSFFVYKKRQIVGRLLLFITIGFVVISPLLIRNIISSGYILFPSSFPDLFSFDWKLRKEYLVLGQMYITAYARTNAEFSLDPNYYAYHLRPSQWIPAWWKLQSVADKFILCALPITLAFFALLRSKIKEIYNHQSLVIGITIIAGITYWFVLAPDPRFGFGYLIPAIGYPASFVVREIQKSIIATRRIFIASFLVFDLVIGVYIFFRIHSYFQTREIFQPSGIEPVPYKTIKKNGIYLNVPDGDHLCGDTELPCSRINCDSVMQRGISVDDGYKSLEQKK